MPSHSSTPSDPASQILVPDSFIALYARPGRLRLSIPREELAARYELCEDLANHLVEQARGLHFGQGVAEDEVLVRCRRGLADPASGLSAAEAGWVVQRLAELLGWPFEAPASPE